MNSTPFQEAGIDSIRQEAVPPDSLTSVQTVTDTSVHAAPIDSIDVFGNLGRDVGEAGRLLVAGEWEQVAEQLYRGGAMLLIEFIPKLISALFVLIIFYILYRSVRSVLRNLLIRSKQADEGIQSLVLKSFTVVAWSLIGMMVLAQFNINVTALLAGLSIAGLAVGFAAKDTLENFISGVTILLDKPFRIGDRIIIDGIYGTVIEITLRSTRLKTLGNEVMVMPNLQMVNQRLLNHSMLGLLRIEVPFGIAYKEYPKQAREIVLALTEGDERIYGGIPPEVVVTALNDSSVDLSLRFFLNDPRLEAPIRFEYVEKIREALREADIEIPFPHLQLFIDEAKAFQERPFSSPLLPPPEDDA